MLWSYFTIILNDLLSFSSIVTRVCEGTYKVGIGRIADESEWKTLFINKKGWQRSLTKEHKVLWRPLQAYGSWVLGQLFRVIENCLMSLVSLLVLEKESMAMIYLHYFLHQHVTIVYGSYFGTWWGWSEVVNHVQGVHFFSCCWRSLWGKWNLVILRNVSMVGGETIIQHKNPSTLLEFHRISHQRVSMPKITMHNLLARCRHWICCSTCMGEKLWLICSLSYSLQVVSAWQCCCPYKNGDILEQYVRDSMTLSIGATF